MKINHSFFSILFGGLLLCLQLSCKKESAKDITPVIPSKDETVTDIDGNIYKTVKIGTQTWMAENLKTTKYNDGVPIPLVIDDSEWINMSTPAYCWYKNDITNKNSYGAFYNWYTVNTGKLSPTGWHVPTESDWEILTTFLGGASISGTELKITGTSIPKWVTPNAGATNSTGFSALPCGYRNYSGNSVTPGSEGCWWSNLENSDLKTYAFYRSVYYSNYNLNSSIRLKFAGLSVRCVKD